jgi:hypothetical protein
MIVNGLHRGENAELVSIDIDNFCASLKLQESGTIVNKVDYADFSKLSV